MDALKPKKTRLEETYNRLVDAICSGEIPPGARLNQDELAGKLNVSRQPVNSAISILKANGLVEDTGRRGVVVTKFDPTLFRSIYEYRKVVEPFSVKLARRSLTSQDRKQADKVLKVGQQAIRKGELVGLVQADMMFHEMIYRWSKNHAIESSMKTNWHHIRRSMAQALRDPELVIPVWEEHQAIIDQLFDGDIDDAAHAMERHIDHAYRTLVGAMAIDAEQDLH